MGDEEFLIPLAFFALAGCLFALASSRAFRARRLLRQSEGLGALEALPLLKSALWLAREAPGLEREILEKLEARFRELGHWVDFADYRTLVDQVEALSGRGTAAAIQGLKQALCLKWEILESLPSEASLPTPEG